MPFMFFRKEILPRPFMPPFLNSLIVKACDCGKAVKD